MKKAILLMFFCISLTSSVAGDDGGITPLWNKSGNVYTCRNCSDCNDAIANASAGDIVQLNESVINQSGTCIDFNGKDNVTFSCQGYTINGDGTGNGIWLSNVGDGSHNNTVRDCPNISSFGSGILIWSSDNNTITNVTTSNNTNGIYIGSFSVSNILYNINSSNNQLGFILALTSNNTLFNVTASGNTRYGIYVWTATDNTLFNATITTSGNQGGFLAYGDSSYRNNITSSVSVDGKPVQYFDSLYKTCPNNSIISYNDTFSHIAFVTCDNVTLENTTASDGIHLWYTDNFRFYNITSSGSIDGIYLYSSGSNTLFNITASDNQDYGIHLHRDSDSNNITDSRIENNTIAGVYLDEIGATDPEYNLIYNNVLNNTLNLKIDTGITNDNYFNTSLTSGINIFGGDRVGGNFWAEPAGTGWSEVCNDSVAPWGVCDESYNLTNGTGISMSEAWDYLPLTEQHTWECSNCSNCNTAIANAAAGDTIILTADIINHSGTCIDFNGKDNITFSCQGNTVSGDGVGVDFGIFLSDAGDGSNNNTVRDCPNISGFDSGIRIQFSSKNTLTNITALNNIFYGISLWYADSNILSNITASDNSRAILLGFSNSNILTNITASNNQQYGIWIYRNADSNNITYSRIENNTLAGIFLDENFGDDPEYNLIYNNFLNNTLNLKIETFITNPNYFNTTLTSASNIIGGGSIGGNFWAEPLGTGWSEVCNDTAPPFGICDEPYNLSNGTSVAVDWLPLTEAICGETINTDLTLAGDLYCPGDTALILGADHITIDCNNYRIYSNNTSNTYGINVSGRNNITIKNCNIEYFDDQIYLKDTNNSILYNNNITSLMQYGLRLVNSNNNNITSNYVSSNPSHAIFLQGSNNNTLIDNSGISNLDKGIYLISSSENTLINNTGTSAEAVGITLDSSHNNTLTNNNGTSNLEAGIYLAYSSNNTLSGNSGTSNSEVGLYLSYSSENNLASNTGISNSYYGIAFESSTLNCLNKSYAAGGTYGIYIEKSNHSNITNAVISGSVKDIYVISDSTTFDIWFINCTFNKSSVNVSGVANNITIADYIRANVTNFTGGGVLQNANVTVYDVNGALVFSEITDVNGLTPWHIGIEYVQNGTGKIQHINYTVNASLANYVNASVSWNISMDESVDVVMMIIDTVQPHIIPYEPGNDTNVSGNALFIGYVSDVVGVKNVSLYLNGTLNQTNSTGLSDINYSFTVSDLAAGIWNWYYRACDYMTPANCNNSVTRTFTLVTTTTTTSATTTTKKKKSSGGGSSGGGVSVPRKESCFDGLLNQNETGVDCGGPCQPCISCSDGVQNQGEEGVDCGGPCPPCETTITSTTVTQTTETTQTTITTTIIPATSTTIQANITPLTTETTLPEKSFINITISPEIALVLALVLVLFSLFLLYLAQRKGKGGGTEAGDIVL